MRWLLRGQSTDTWVNDGGGMSEGDGKMYPNLSEYILITMAGCAVEGGYGCMGLPVWDETKPFDDIDDLRRFFHNTRLREQYESENHFLDKVFDMAGLLLYPHMDLIEDMATALLEKKKVSAAELRRLCKRHGVKPMTPAEIAKIVPPDSFSSLHDSI